MNIFSSNLIFKSASTVLAAGLICVSFAQSVNLSGTVKDSSTQKAISGVTVSLKGLSLTTITDANGAYILTGSPVQHQKNSNPFNHSPVFKNNTLFFGITNDFERVRMEIFDLSGRISPNKTIEGAVGGAVFATATALVFRTFAGFDFLHALGCGMVLSCAGILGDILSSRYKRLCGLKDFSAILPGQGGIIDRFNSFFAAATVFLVFRAFC